jgi:cytochrome b561
MTMTNARHGTDQGYTLYQIGLHWLIAALVLVQLLFGESMTTVIDAAEEGGPVSPLDANLAGLHYYVGIAILALVAIRLALRLKNGAPPPPPETSGLIELAGKLSHWLFYALLVAVPVTGLLGYYYGDPYGALHSLAKPVFIALIALHVAASLYHQFWRKDGLLLRMFKPRA